MVHIVQPIQIPQHLLHCYRGNATQPRIANSFQIFLELIRKIEDANPTSIDIRRFSVNLFHQLRLDGIERAPSILEQEFVTPFRANGKMTPKFELLLELISNVPGPIEFQRFLTPDEVCILHRIVSSSVEPFERGDESRVCPLNLMSDDRVESPWIHINKHQNLDGTATAVSERISRCPLELGVARSQDYDSFSPGTVIASIAAGLQPQNVRINEFVSLQHKKPQWENLETMTENDSEQSLNKLLNSLNSIDNTYAAGLSGDLAEVCVYQGPYLGVNSSVGLAGSWNDTHFPRIRYLSERHRARWEFTDSEILAGIDGIFLSNQISNWLQRIRRLRLSQVIDMYYSARGIPAMAIESANRGRSSNRKPIHLKKDNEESREALEPQQFSSKSNSKLSRIFNDPDLELREQDEYLERFSVNDGITSACNRRTILRLIDREKLKDETYFMSQVLQYTTSSLAITDEALRINCDAAVDNFFNYAELLIDKIPTCSQILTDFRKPVVDLTLIIDGSRGIYENQQLISSIADLIDVSSYGSSISVIHGQSGLYLVNRTNSVTTAFAQLQNFTGSYPIGISLSRSLGAIVRRLSNLTETDRINGLYGGLSQVVLVVSQSQRISQTDFASAKRMIEGSFQQFPDLYFVFLTNDPDTFNEMVHDAQAIFDIKRQQEHYKIIESNSIDPSDFSHNLFRHLKLIPKRIMAPFCDTLTAEERRMITLTTNNQNWNSFEDYATVNQELRYRISPFYLRNADQVSVEFQGVSYGSLIVCLSRDVNYSPLECKTVEDLNVAEFTITRPCDDIFQCYGLYFSVIVEKSNVRCTENDCRYPDQVRFMVRPGGLTCEVNRRRSRSSKISFSLRMLALVFMVILADKIRNCF